METFEMDQGLLQAGDREFERLLLRANRGTSQLPYGNTYGDDDDR
jgi:hypothetical protein